MSTVLRPVGPEPAQTYWLRRIAVIGVAIVVLAVAGALIANGTSSGSAVQANPSLPPPTVPTALAGSSTPTLTPGPGASASSSTPAAASPKSATPKPSKTPTAGPVACTVSELRPTLTGKQRLKIKERSAFTLSVINGSDQTCIATVDPNTFELRIYSGSDRIWSTKDCATLVKPLRRTLDAEEALEWKLPWNGHRSRSGCRSDSDIPQVGPYWATAELAGAEPVRLRMTLRD